MESHTDVLQSVEANGAHICSDLSRIVRRHFVDALRSSVCDDDAAAAAVLKEFGPQDLKTLWRAHCGGDDRAALVAGRRARRRPAKRVRARVGLLSLDRSILLYHLSLVLLWYHDQIDVLLRNLCPNRL